MGYPLTTSRTLATLYACWKKINLHIFILNRFTAKAEDGLCVDHIDRIKVNNSFDNLRVVSYQKNLRNRTITSDDRPNISYGLNEQFYVQIKYGDSSWLKRTKSLNLAMLYFDHIVLENNLEYGTYFAHSYNSFYSGDFLNQFGIHSSEDIIKLNDRQLRGYISKYQNITWVEDLESWKVQIRFNRKWIIQKRFGSEDEALNFREQFFIDNPQYITKLTKAYTKSLQQLKAKLFPHNKFLNIHIKQ